MFLLSVRLSEPAARCIDHACHCGIICVTETGYIVVNGENVLDQEYD